jgi:hypothetical protein
MAQQVAALGLGTEAWPGSLTTLVQEAVSVLANTEAGENDGLVLVLDVDVADGDASRLLAAREALRSLMHASSLERPSLAVNLVVGGDTRDRATTLQYLAGPDAGFVRGATLDLGPAA